MEQTGSHSVSWTNLPTIEVTVKPVGYILNDLQEHFTNALFFTLESLCNISPNFTEHTQVSTVFPLDEVMKYVRSQKLFGTFSNVNILIFQDFFVVVS